MSLNNLYTYWEGKKPAYIELCQESLKNSGMNVIILGKDDYPELNHLKINHKTDYLKAWLILENGGFWIDADMIVMKNLTPLKKLVKEHGFAGIPGFFGAKKGNRVVERWFKSMQKIIQSELTFSDLIQPLLQDPEFEEFGIFTKEMICPIYHTGNEFWNFFKDLDVNDFVTKNTYVVTLYNSSFSDEFKKMNKIDILNNPWLISKMFRKALWKSVQ